MPRSPADLAAVEPHNLKEYPWLLAKLESHRRSCCPDLDRHQAFSFGKSKIDCLSCRLTISDGRLRSSRSVGIIGFGNFGHFLAPHLARVFKSVVVSDALDRARQSHDLGLMWTSPAEVARQQIVVLAVPFQDLEQVLQQTAASFRSDALVIDVCSVKRAPIELMLEYLPASVDIVGTHPLFGPQSAKAGVAGHRIAFCPVRIARERADALMAFLTYGFELQVFERTPEAHDREMAKVQALTHFVARALAASGIERSELATFSYDKLCDAMELLSGDSWELFKTIELGNPYAAEIRSRFLAELKDLEDKLKR